MQIISKGDYKILSQFQAEYSRVLDSHYKLPTPESQDRQVLEIVRKYDPGYYHKFGCSVCAYNLYARAGTLVRNFEKEMEAKKTRKSSTKEVKDE